MTVAELLLSKGSLQSGQAIDILKAITIGSNDSIIPIVVKENPFSFNKKINRFFNDTLKVEVYALKLIKDFREQRDELPFKIKYVSSKFTIRN